MADIKIGDVVYADGVKMILGDVLSVTDNGIEVRWRATTTTGAGLLENIIADNFGGPI